MGDGGTQHNERAERRTVEDRPQKAPTRDSTVTPLDVEDGLSQHSDERVAVSPSPPKITALQRSWLKRQQEEEEEESTDQAIAQPKRSIALSADHGSSKQKTNKDLTRACWALLQA